MGALKSNKKIQGLRSMKAAYKKTKESDDLVTSEFNPKIKAIKSKLFQKKKKKHSILTQMNSMHENAVAHDGNGTKLISPLSYNKALPKMVTKDDREMSPL